MLALEEPATHLHPYAIRALSSMIKGFAGQKIIATHSGDLISDVGLLSIRRFHRVGGRSRSGGSIRIAWNRTTSGRCSSTC